MQKPTTTRHTIRISNTEARGLQEGARTGWLQMSHQPLSGLPSAVVYIPEHDNRSHQTALNLSTLQIGSRTIEMGLHSLPEPELQALLHQSPGSAVRADRELLINQLLQPMDFIAQMQWVTRLVADVGNVTTSPQPGNHVTWLPDQTRLAQMNGLWFASLAFDVPPGTRLAQAQRKPVGIDVGIAPLAVAATKDTNFKTCPLHFLAGAGMRALERYMRGLPVSVQERVRLDLEQLEYGAASRALEELTSDVQLRASSVTAEKLDLAKFQGPFVRRGRRLAIIDFHQSVLPQRLYAAGIPFQRVPAALTSQLCCRCGRRGARDGAVFTCATCGAMDAHVCAARNLIRRGAGAARRRSGRR